MKHLSLLPILLSAVLLLGASNATADEPPAGAGLNEGSAAAPASPLAIAPTERLLGTWTVNLRRTLSHAGVPDEQIALIESHGNIQISLTFSAGGLLTIHGTGGNHDEVALAHYEVLSTEGNVLVLRTLSATDGSETTRVRTPTVTLETNDTIIVQDADEARSFYDRSPTP